jgi:hypothetical protein
LRACRFWNEFLGQGGEKSFGLTMAVVMRAAATHVKEGVVPESGHWIIEEGPQATVALVRTFLESEAQARLTSSHISAMKHTGASEGTSGVSGIQTRALKGARCKVGRLAAGAGLQQPSVDRSR